jgi:endoglucanase
MVAAHMDEIGIMATYIDDKGFYKIFGYWLGFAVLFAGQRVRFKNGAVGAVFYEESWMN